MGFPRKILYEEMEWTDIYTDDLISILSILEKYNVELNMMINP